MAAKCKLIVSCLSSLLQGYLEQTLGNSPEQEQDAEQSSLEDQLCRLEDAAILLLKRPQYIMSDSRHIALARLQRIPLQLRMQTMGRQLIMYRGMSETMENHAAYVLQQLWRQRQQALKAEGSQNGVR